MRRTISFLLITASTVLVWALLFSTHPRAQQPAGADPMVKRGEELYAQSCTAFCHGPGGAQGQQAPQLANRNFDEQYIERVITYGVPGTAMPAWGQRLIKEELVPIMTYVKYLNGIAPPSSTLRTLPAEASTGRELFFDPTQELGACSNCHTFEGKGISVARQGDDITVVVRNDRLFTDGGMLAGDDILEPLGAVLDGYVHTKVTINGFTDTSGTPDRCCSTGCSRGSWAAR